MLDGILLGNLHIVPERFEVRLGTEPVTLTGSEFRVLMALAEECGRVWPPRQLARAAGIGANNRGALATLIWRLRKKLAGSDPYAILMVRQRGYVLAPRKAAQRSAMTGAAAGRAPAPADGPRTPH